MAASSSSCPFDAFLSFRGDDVRKTFADHVYAALTGAGIHTFRDDEEIERGKNIDQELTKAIQQSKVAVIVFSPDYASSRCCLDELLMINERRKSDGMHILPIFYHVDPSAVWRQKESFKEAFDRHEEQLKEEIDKVERWRAALKEVADLGGEVLKDQYEAPFIQNIVKLVANKLDRKLLHVGSYLTGIDDYVGRINQWLQDESTNVRILVLYGIGGVGKTTIAKTVYNQNSDKFERSCFLADVAETSEQPKGMNSLQEQLLSDIHKRESVKIYNVDEGVMKIKDAMCCMKVIIILDNVDNSEQFKSIIGKQEWLSSGSKMIVTTRLKCLLSEGCWKLHIEPLSVKKSHKLFALHAFGREDSPENFDEHSERVVSLCDGLPLALCVLGSFLRRRSIDEWKSEIKELQEIPDSQIQKILRKSFDSLHNDRHRSIFLHIVFFFIGWGKDVVVKILEGCGFEAIIGVQHLLDRCLIEIDERNNLAMHQLVRDMGREVVRQESPDEPGKRSRICNHKEGTETIRGLILDMHLLREEKHVGPISNYGNYSHENSVEESVLGCEDNRSMHNRLGGIVWQRIVNCIPKTSSTSADVIKTEAFANMRQLNVLLLDDVKLDGGYEDFPKHLVCLRWLRFPLNSMPTCLNVEKLVVLDMRYSRLKHAWQGKSFPCLKILDLSHSHLLTTTPDFTGLPGLESLLLKDCINLVKIDKSIRVLRGLVLLNLEGCAKLKELPKTISDLKSLEELYLTGCSELKVLPKVLAQMESLKVFFAGGITLNELSFSSRDVRGPWSWLSGREGPESTMFSSAFLPRSLTHLILPNCNLSDGKFTTDLHLPSLRHLVLRDNPLNTISAEIPGLPSLVYLDITQCNNFNVIIKVPTSIEELNLIGRLVTRLSDLLRFGLEDISSGRENRFMTSFCQNVVQLVQSDCPYFRRNFIIMNNNVWCQLQFLGDGLRSREILQENTSGPSLAHNLLLWDMHKGKLLEADEGYMKTGSFLAILRVFIESLI
ncbi:disease resistance protein RPV1 isoform X2 [Hevea brasiliensis]|uniref:disease resistance protein RPV1 isoform X2 n=1 Tax=Hevea brasiliensis TaxID=3981 RepID=UPI0025FA64DD|nr:disease resistance protein RPV1 isoform X2 [Hevea brasiliensis]